MHQTLGLVEAPPNSHVYLQLLFQPKVHTVRQKIEIHVFHAIESLSPQMLITTFRIFLPFLERTANGDVVFTLKNGVSHIKIFSGVVEL